MSPHGVTWPQWVNVLHNFKGPMPSDAMEHVTLHEGFISLQFKSCEHHLCLIWILIIQSVYKLVQALMACATLGLDLIIFFMYFDHIKPVNCLIIFFMYFDHIKPVNCL